MKRTMKKLIAALGAAVLLTASITVQAEEDSTKNDSTTVEGVAEIAETSGEAVETEDLYDGLDPDSIVLTVGEDKIPLKKAYFLVKFQQAIVQDMQKSVYGSLWYSLPVYEGDRSFQDNMKESIMNLLTRMSLAKQYQKELGVSISKSEQEKIEKAADLFIASNSEEALAAMMADKETVVEVLTDYTILSKVITAVTKDTKAEYGEAKTYSYVYGSFGEDAGGDLNDVSEETETLMEDFNNIYTSVASGTDFDTAAAEQGYPTALHTYFIDDDSDALAEFNQAMEGKELGEVCEVTTVGDNQGIFIGCMQELDEDSLEAAKASYLKSQQLKELRKTMKTWIGKSEPVIDETIWSQVTMKKSMAAYRAQTTE